MSDPHQSEEPGAMPAGPDAVLRFSCSNCGKELTAPPSAAGVEGPCPVCGATTRAPEAMAAPPRDVPPARAPVAPIPSPAPHPAPASAAPPQGPPASLQPASQEAAPPYKMAPSTQAVPPETGSALPRERRERRRAKRAIDPATAFSSSYQDSKEVGAVVRIVLAVLCTAAITIGVFFFVQKKINQPPPEPEPDFPLTH